METSNILKFAREMFILMCAIVISFILQLTGFITPGWFRIYLEIPHESLVFRADIGLWYSSIEFCNKSGCVTKSVGEFYADSGIKPKYAKVGDVEVMTTLALMSCTAAFVTALMLRRQLGRRKLSKVLFIVSIMGSVVSGAMAISSAAYCGVVIRREDSKLIQRFKEYYKESIFSFPYSLVLTGLGGLIGPFTFGLLLSIWYKLSKIVRSHVSTNRAALTTFAGNI